MKTLSAIITIAVALASFNTNSIVTSDIQATAVLVAEEVSSEVVTEIEPEIEPEAELISLGEFKITTYCSCSKCCGKWALNRPVDAEGNEIVIGAAGKVLTAGYSVAVDTELIPYGTILVIDGLEYEAQDCGGEIKGNRIDVYFSNHKEAKEHGVQYKEVFINAKD